MKKIKVLITPNNVASMPTFLVEGLNATGEVIARGVFSGRNKYIYEAQDGSCFYFDHFPNNALKNFIYRVRFLCCYLYHILWADIIHYVWDAPNLKGLDLWLIRLLRKKMFVEWVGSDIRIPEIAKTISPFATAMYEHPGFEYKGLESYEKSMAIQRKFAAYGAIPMLYPEMDLFVDKQLFPKRYFTNQRLPVSHHQLSFPSVTTTKPLLVHSPTAPILKGSEYIISALNDLRSKYDFEFVLLTNKPREEVQAKIQSCDIFIDQIVLGAHGLAFCEAMAYGKPVVCYIAEKVLENHFPEDCPVVNANPTTIHAQLEMLLQNATLRYELGVKGRAYAEKYHDSAVVATAQLAVYKKERSVG